MSIGKRIYELRQELDIKQKELAEKVDITEATLSRYENGKRNPNAEIAGKIAKALGVTTDFLLGRTDIKNPKEEFNPKLTIKDEKDIEKTLIRTLDMLQDSQDGLMFDGEPMDDLTRVLLAESLKSSMETAKKIAKEKYTPKKYK